MTLLFVTRNLEGAILDRYPFYVPLETLVMAVRVLQWLPDRSGFSRSNSAWVALDMQVVREITCCQLDFSTFSIGVIASSLAALAPQPHERSGRRHGGKVVTHPISRSIVSTWPARLEAQAWVAQLLCFSRPGLLIWNLICQTILVSCWVP